MKRFSIVLVASLFVLASCHSEDTEEGFTIGFVGDILLDRGVRKEMSKNGAATFYQKLSKQLVNTDFLVGNLECPITEEVQPVHKKFVFRGDTANARYLSQVGFTHLSLANNHAYDQSRTGMVSTAEVLHRYGIEPMGYAELTAVACSPTVIAQHDVNVAIFSTVTLALENWFPQSDKPGMCQEDGISLAQRIDHYAKLHPTHHIIVFIHWGIEHSTEASPDQRKLARALIDSGADIIIGHHPHVLQPHEQYKGKDIYYSLGNFIFDQDAPINTQSKLLKIQFETSDYSIEEVNYRIVECLPMVGG